MGVTGDYEDKIRMGVAINLAWTESPLLTMEEKVERAFKIKKEYIDVAWKRYNEEKQK